MSWFCLKLVGRLAISDELEAQVESILNENDLEGTLWSRDGEVFVEFDDGDCDATSCAFEDSGIPVKAIR